MTRSHFIHGQYKEPVVAAALTHDFLRDCDCMWAHVSMTCYCASVWVHVCVCVPLFKNTLTISELWERSPLQSFSFSGSWIQFTCHTAVPREFWDFARACSFFGLSGLFSLLFFFFPLLLWPCHCHVVFKNLQFLFQGKRLSVFLHPRVMCVSGCLLIGLKSRCCYSDSRLRNQNKRAGCFSTGSV